MDADSVLLRELGHFIRGPAEKVQVIVPKRCLKFFDFIKISQLEHIAILKNLCQTRGNSVFAAYLVK